MQLYLIRHAESENNARPAFQRVEDPALTARGRLQAEHLGQWIKTLSIDTLITSPFLRTLQTTRLVVDAAPQPVHIWHDVYERGGCFVGHLPDDQRGGLGLGRQKIMEQILGEPREAAESETEIVDAVDQCLIDESIDQAGWWAGKQRESEEEALQRARLVTDRMIDTFGATGQVVVAIIHADFKRLLLGEMLRTALDTSLLGPMRNTGISKIDFDGHAWRLDWLNSVTHLPHRLITGKEH